MQKFGDFLKQYLYIILGIICILAVGGIYLTSRPTTIAISPIEAINNPAIIPYEPVEEPIFPDSNSDIEYVEYEPTLIIVHIVGAVNYPGVFEVPEGSRIDDVVRLAGGHTEEADLTLINLAAFVHDAMQIIVPKFGEEVFETTTTTDPSSGVTPPSNGLVNINTATSAELQTLPNIGPSIAENIINFREMHGRFSSVDELINVSRIGTATMERLRPLITV